MAETTAPPWTPLFAVAAAVVTDTGGILSHCAVVAREYGIPAVVGAGTATAVDPRRRHRRGRRRRGHRAHRPLTRRGGGAAGIVSAARARA